MENDGLFHKNESMEAVEIVPLAALTALVALVAFAALAAVCVLSGLVDPASLPIAIVPRCSEVVQQLYMLLLQVYGFEKELGQLQRIQSAMAELAAACGNEGFEQLADAHGPSVLDAACSAASRWVHGRGWQPVGGYGEGKS